jgi:NhaP-type Na+/H+ or K+/H+ antiporter
VVFSVVALFGVRLVAVLVALIRSDLPMHNRLFIGWFGPRGIGTLVLALLVVSHGELQQEPLILQVVAVTVTLSLVVHSLAAWPGIRWLADSEGGATEQPAATQGQSPP